MKTTLHSLFVTALLLSVTACSDSDQGASSGGSPSSRTEVDPSPLSPDATLIETLLAKRTDKTPIYIADNKKKPESEVLAGIKAELTDQKIKFQEPPILNYPYYVQRAIRLLRRQGRLWMIHDPALEELAASFRDSLFAKHHVELQLEFDDGILSLISNEFPEANTHTCALEAYEGVKANTTTTNIVFTEDDTYLFVTGKAGAVRWYSRTSDHKGVALQLPKSKKGEDGVFAAGESGMIGAALHPQFASNRKIYLHYNWQYADGTREAILSEWDVDFSGAPGKVRFTNERKLFMLEQAHDNHNAGCLAFGPDGYLYISIGDGETGKWTIGRSPSDSMRGKVLRIDVDHQDEGKQYRIPADNPFVDHAEIPPETWAWGFRNPWRLVFLPDGRLIASDIGEDVNEELTYVVKGKHHGWPYWEGNHKRNDWKLGDTPLQPPLLPYGRDYGMSVVAGAVYDGLMLPELQGRFVFCDYMSGNVWAIDLPETDTTLDIGQADLIARWPLLLPTITRAPDGELYFGTHTGEVLKLVRGGGGGAGEELAKADPESARSLFGAEFEGAQPPTATQAMVDLGRQLFGDVRLSADGSKSCATCHDPSKYGQDGVAKVSGADGTERNTPSILNAHRQFAQFRDFRVETVEEAVTESLTCHMGHEDLEAVATALGEVSEYGDAFGKAFPRSSSPITAENVGLAIGSFVRQLGTTSRWEKFLDGDDSALNDTELIGLNEFIRVGCLACHLYRGLGGGMQQKLGLQVPWTGPDLGRSRIDETPGQEYFFKVPSLFNVSETAPYYHDGSMATLADAVRNMAEIQLARTISEEQVSAIVTFLESMTGEVPQALR